MFEPESQKESDIEKGLFHLLSLAKCYDLSVYFFFVQLPFQHPPFLLNDDVMMFVDLPAIFSQEETAVIQQSRVKSALSSLSL